MFRLLNTRSFGRTSNPSRQLCATVEKVYDVIVVGLGGHGAASAAHLASKGMNVLGLERFSGVHANGSSHGHSRIIRLAYFEDKRYVPLLKRSFELWRRLQSSNDDKDILVLTGGLMIGHPESAVIQGTLNAAKEHNLPHEVWQAAKIRREIPHFKPDDEEIGVYEMMAGWLNPEHCTEAHHKVARQYGAKLQFDEVFEGFHRTSPDNIAVKTNKGIYNTKKIVMAAGAWTPALLGNLIPVKLSVERRVLCWFEPNPSDGCKSDDLEQRLESFRHLPIYIWDMGVEGNFYGFPYTDTAGPDDGVKVCRHSITAEEKKRFTCTPDTIDREVTEYDIESLQIMLRDKIPALGDRGQAIAATTCMYTVTPDEHFLIDFLPSDKDILVVSACSGHGYKFSSVIGEIVAELTIDGKTELDTSLFRIRENIENDQEVAVR